MRQREEVRWLKEDRRIGKDMRLRGSVVTGEELWWLGGYMRQREEFWCQENIWRLGGNMMQRWWLGGVLVARMRYESTRKCGG
jgi:hypothetical protein